jgi:lysophospholipase L1-like esterase
MQLFWVTTAVLVALLLLVELGLRLFGFGNPLVYVADPQIGYLLAPNQKTRRFGNTIAINQYSMRSPEVSPTRSETVFRVLLLGDSIVNGGWWTDQTNTISALLQQQLQSKTDSATSATIEVLNASANSWGPRNELAYLQRFGSFQAQVIVLVINTDDLFATAPTSAGVGQDPNYPDRRPPLAIAEVWQRYLVKPKPAALEASQPEEKDRVGVNLAAIQQVQAVAQQNNAKFILLMTPLLRELGSSGPRDYEQVARQRLQAMTQADGMIFVDFLPIFNRLPNPQALYHDHIHFNLAGNQQITEQIKIQIQKLLAEGKGQ